MALPFRSGLALVILSCAISASAQRRSGTPASFISIHGQVLYAGSNRPVVGAYVMLEGEGGGVETDTITGSNGRFEFGSLRATVYFVVAEMAGYHRTGERVDLTFQNSAYLPIFLYPKKGSNFEQAPEGTIPVESLAVPPEAQKEFARGKSLLEKHDMAGGQQHLHKAVRLYPQYAAAYHLLGTSYLAQKKWPEAEAALKHSLEINGKFAPSQFALAALYKQEGNDAKAQEALKRGVESDPNSWQGHLELTQTLLTQGKVSEAKIHAQRAHELEPKTPLVHVILANVLLREGGLVTAREEYQHYLDLAPDGPLAPEVKKKIEEINQKERQLALHSASMPASTMPPAAREEFNKGKKELDKGRLDEALRHFRRALDASPGYIEAQHMVGTILMDQEKWSEAEKNFNASLQINDKYPPTYVALGRLYNLQGDPTKAGTMLERALELDPSSWQAHFELAQSFLAQRKVKEAETHAERAHELQPDFPPVHIVLGNVRLSKRDLRAARDEFQHYLDAVPEGPLSVQLQEKIRQINPALLLQEPRTEPSKP